MRFSSVHRLLPVASVVAIAVVAACSQGKGDATAVQVSDASNPASVVISMYAGATSAPSGTCLGTVIAPRLVLTAGHCVAGKASWKVTATLANNQEAAGVRAHTYNWINYKTDLSHPTQSDLAVIELDHPISLATYPTVAATGAPDGTLLSRFRRATEGVALSKSRLQSASVIARDGASEGFPAYYAVAGENGEMVDTGGALIDPVSNKIYGVVSGRGTKTGSFYISRVDGAVANAWVPETVRAYTTASEGMTTGDATPPGYCFGNCLGEVSGDTADSPFPTTICTDGGTFLPPGTTGGTTTGTTTGGTTGATTGSTTGATTGTNTGKTSGGTTGDTTGGSGGTPTGGTTTGKTSGGTTTGTTTGGTTTGKTSGGTTGASTGDTTGGSGGTPTGGTTTGKTSGGTTTGGTTTGKTTGGTTTGGTTAGKTSGGTTGDTTGGSGGTPTGGTTTGSTAGSTVGSSTGGSGGTPTGGTTTGSTGGTPGSTSGGSSGASSGGTGGGSVCTGASCGGCSTTTPTCQDNTIDYGDCACNATPVVTQLK